MDDEIHAALEEDDVLDEDLDGNLDDDLDDPTDDEDVEDVDDEEDGNGDSVELDALEAEELETVEVTESATMLVDETGEIREIRRSEMNLDVESEEMQGDEFVCRTCFLLLKKVQLADDSGSLCRDCA